MPYLFSPLFVDGHLSCFCLVAIENNSAVVWCTNTFTLSLLSVRWGLYLSQIAEFHHRSALNFQENATLVSMVAVAFYTPVWGKKNPSLSLSFNVGSTRFVEGLNVRHQRHSFGIAKSCAMPSLLD